MHSKLRLSEKYEPLTRKDLVVNKMKVDQLDALIDRVINQTTGSILLIEGPSGCGKSATLKVLCKEKNIELVQWNSDAFTLKDLNSLDNNENIHQGLESQSKALHQFLFRSSRYLTDQLFESNQKAMRSKKMLFIKTLPNFVYTNTQAFNDMLKEFIRYSKFPLVFSLVTTPKANAYNPMRLFSSELRSQLNMCEISFNALANSYMQKVIERIVEQENFDYNILEKQNMEQLLAISNNDLRYAINLIELNYSSKTSNSNFNNYLMPTNRTKRARVSNKSTKQLASQSKNKSINTSLSSLLLHDKKDVELTIFHSLGKILHRKNLVDSQEIDDQVEQEMPSHLKHFERKPLSFQPEDLVNKMSISCNMMQLYLHHNFIQLLSKKTHSVNSKQILKFLKSISSDFLITDKINSNRLQLSENNHTIDNMSMLITARSILFNNFFDTNSSKSVWAPLNKPIFYKANELKSSKIKSLKNMIIADDWPLEYLLETKTEMFTNYLPYMLKILHLKEKQGNLTQTSKKNELGKLVFNKILTNTAARLPLQSNKQLRDNDVDIDIEEDEEDLDFFVNKNFI